MILPIKEHEAAALILHMSIMRNEFKKLLKRNYKGDRKLYLNAYDYVKSECEKQLEEKQQQKEHELDHLQLEVLTAFLTAYLEKLYIASNDVYTNEQLAQLTTLEGVQARCSALIEYVA